MLRSTLAAVLAALLLVSCGKDAVEPRVAVQLAFVAEPGTAQGQAVFDPAVRVMVQDAHGDPVTEPSREVTIRLAANPTGGTLSGTLTARTVGGIGTFANLSVERPGDGYILQATTPGLPPLASAGFSVRLTFVQVGVGPTHSCGVTAPGFLYCWGTNFSGQLGDGTNTNRLIPTPVALRQTFTQVSGGSERTCAVGTTGAAYCWGTQHGVPTVVGGGVNNFTQVSAGSRHICGVTTDRVAYCWGSNSFGELGDGTGGGSNVPVRVAGGLSFVQVTAGDHHSCAIAPDRKAYCWGDNYAGALGDGTVNSRIAPGAPVAGDRSFDHVSAAFQNTCGVAAEKIYCWGA